MTANRNLRRTLLVDDADELRHLVRIVLEQSGRYVVVGEAADGAAAIDAAGELDGELDLIVLDLSMPRMDGLEALPHLRRLVPDARVVVLSAFSETTTAAAAIDAGAHGYVEKGGSPASFLAALDDAAGAEGGTTPARVIAPVASQLDTAEVVARLAHDVRTPLMTARGAVELVGSRVPIDDPDLRELMTRAVVALERVDATLQATVDHAHAGSAPLAAVAVDLRATAEEAATTLDEGARERVQVEGPPVSVPTDASALQRILVILLDNACRYAPGAVTVRVVASPDHGTIEVEDDGPGLGVDPARLFSPFVRGDAGAALPGSGLGLSTAAELARRLGGTLSASSAPGGGASFALELPR